jgi:4-amino-4-deoxy-L-arabinose transferase-like glycosyltransferase
MARHVFAIVVLAAMAGLLGVTSKTEGVTVDEPYHLTRGLAYWWTGSANLSWAHPPLSNALAGLPHSANPNAVDLTQFSGYARSDTARLAPAFFEAHWDIVRRGMFASRSMMAALALLFAAYVYVVCTRELDRRSAQFALAFVALHPFVLGHGKLVTTDTPLTCFLGVALLELVAWLRGGATWRALSMSLACGAAFATKFSAVYFLPVLICAPVAFALMRRGRFLGVARLRGVLTAAGVVLLAGLVSVGAVNAVYRFEGTLMTLDELRAAVVSGDAGSRAFVEELGRPDSPLAKLPASVPIPLPARYVHGLISVADHSDDGHSSWYWGQAGDGGWRSYFPVLLLIKSPTSLLLTLAASLASLVGLRRAPSARSWVLVGYAATVLLSGVASNLNIGVRHVMPIVVPLSVLGGRALALAWERWGSRGVVRWCFAGLAVLHVGGVATGFPDYIGDFNWLVGGRRGGRQISVVGEDWGQDSLRLRAALRARRVRALYYVNTAAPAFLELKDAGIEPHSLRCKEKPAVGSWVAIHETKRVRDETDCYTWLTDRRPDVDIAGHIGLWRTTKDD